MSRPRTAEGRKLLAERDYHLPSCPRWFAVSDPDAPCDCGLPNYVWAIETAAIEQALAEFDKFAASVLGRPA